MGCSDDVAGTGWRSGNYDARDMRVHDPAPIASPGTLAGVPYDSMVATYGTVGSLYDVLAEPAPTSAAAGETLSTRKKETVDNDVETAALDELMR